MNMNGALEALTWRFNLKIGFKLRFRLNAQQKQALAGKIPMTKELFWSCLTVYYLRFDMEQCRKIWNQYPEYITQWRDEFDREMADCNSQLRKQSDALWADMRPKLIAYCGEDWVKAHSSNNESS